MKPPKKNRPDSPLRNLPEDRQAAIIEELRTKSILEVSKWLAADGFKVSTGALSEFRSWWYLRQGWARKESRVDAMLENIKRQREARGVPIPAEELASYGQEMFTLLALEEEDPKSWAVVQKLRIADERTAVMKGKLASVQEQVKTAQKALMLARERFRRETCELFLKWFEKKSAKEIATGNLSHADKIEKLGQTMFGEDW